MCYLYCDSSVGNQTYIGMSVKGTGQNVSKVDSDPIDELDDNDKNRYYIGDAKETRTWLEINAGITLRKEVFYLYICFPKFKCFTIMNYVLMETFDIRQIAKYVGQYNIQSVKFV